MSQRIIVRWFGSLCALIALVGCSDNDGLLTNPASGHPEMAAAIQYPAAGVLTPTVDLTNARIWIDDEGIQHMRGGSISTEVIGVVGGIDYYAIGSGIVDWDIDFATGNGEARVAELFDSTWGDLTGTFRSRSVTTYTAWQAYAEYIQQGGGDFRGMKSIGTITGAFGVYPFHYEGYLLDPHGE